MLPFRSTGSYFPLSTSLRVERGEREVEAKTDIELTRFGTSAAEARRQRSRARFLVYYFFLMLALPCIYLTVNHKSRFACPDGMTCTPRAKSISPQELMRRSPSHSAPSKIIHQSWGPKPLTANALAWSNTWRTNHPDWEYVLWRDEDNRQLVELFLPNFLQAYDALQPVIKKADAARNIYMYAFGGVYADFDLESITSLDSLFGNGTQSAYLGQMGSSSEWDQSLPNDWMASSRPGNIFFLLPLMQILELESSGYGKEMRPEEITGPGALFAAVKQFQSKYENDQAALSERVKTLMTSTASQGPHRLRILAPELIHPFSWGPEMKKYQDCCLGYSANFHALRCKEQLRVQQSGSYAIAYWTHSWAKDSKGSIIP